MADGVDIQWIHRGLFTATRYRCLKRGPCDGEEAQAWHVIALPTGGSFEVRGAFGRVLADANHAVLFNKGQPYETHHPCGHGDVGVGLVIPVEAALALTRPFGGGDPDRPFGPAFAVLPPSALPLQVALLAALASPDADGLAADEAILALSALVVERAWAGRGAYPHKGETRRFHRDQVEAVKAVLSSHLGEPMGLAEIGRAVAASPYHLARLFKEHTGMAIHQYRTQLRLREAVGRLAGGAPDLTALALELGFSSHAHLTATFTRAVGRPPSEVRAQLA